MPNWLVNLCNRINDADLTWVGFRSLRPAIDQDMNAAVVTWLCLVYCPLAAGIAFAITYLILGSRGPAAVPWGMAGAAAIAFLLMQTALAYAWNHRAARRRAEKHA